MSNISWNSFPVNTNFNEDITAFKTILIQGMGFIIKKACSSKVFKVLNYDIQVIKRNEKIDCSQEFNYLLGIIMLTGHEYRKQAILDCIKLSAIDLGDDHPSLIALKKLYYSMEKSIKENSPELELEKRDLERKHSVCLK